MVAVCRCGQNHDVLTTRLGRKRSGRICPGDSLSSLCAASEYDVVYLWRSGQFCQRVALGDDNLQSLLGHTSVPERFGEEPRHGSGNGSRLQDTCIARSQSSHHSAARYGTREVPRRDDQDSTLGLDVNIFQGVELLHRRSIETSIVNALAYLHIALDYSLARDGTHTANQIAAHLAQTVCSIIHYPVTLLNCSLAPSCWVLSSDFDNLLHLLSISLGHLAYLDLIVLTTVEILGTRSILDSLCAYLRRNDIRSVALRLLPLSENPALPLLVALAVEVSIWFVDHLVHRRYGLVGLQTILLAMRLVRYGILDGIRVLKLFLQEIPCLRTRLEVKRMSQEVVGGSILVHAAHEI